MNRVDKRTQFAAEEAILGIAIPEMLPKAFARLDANGLTSPMAPFEQGMGVLIRAIMRLQPGTLGFVFPEHIHFTVQDGTNVHDHMR